MAHMNEVIVVTSGNGIDLVTTYSQDISTETAHDSALNSLSPWLLAALCCIGLVGAPANALTIAAICRAPGLQKANIYLILNLALSDLLHSLGIPVSALLTLTSWGLQYTSANRYSCLLSLWGMAILAQSSVVSILLISFERFLSVKAAVWHRRVVTSRNIKITVAVSWAVYLINASLPLMGWNTWQPNFCDPINSWHWGYLVYTLHVTNAIGLTLTAVCYVVIGKEALSRTKKQHPVEAASSSVTQKFQFSLLKTVLLVVGVFYAMRIPVLIVSAAVSRVQPEPSSALSAVFDFTRVVIGLGPIVNPVIYARHCPQIKAALKHILK